MFTKRFLLFSILILIHESLVSTLPSLSISEEESSSIEDDSEEDTVPVLASEAENRICPNNTGMNDRIRTIAKVAHNYRRGRLARGLVKNKRGRNLPKASNMRELVYDCNLESSAHAFAETCTRGKDPSLPSDVQQNHFYFRKDRKGKDGKTRMISTRRHAMKVAIRHWWKQLKVHGGIGHEVTFKSDDQSKPIQQFTRMAWATTDSLGCGVASCGNFWSAVCHYKPGGNVPNEHIYEKGRPCSACPANMFCTVEKLCSSLDAII
ncbi:hypothetical protein V3C99_014350 [Haemonchus contortus]|uniref:SCP domain-containing protein n=1 Tax=Haemonchus contortus TaxID=6289 RepID=A0A7I4YTV6_HAECO|nr:SCP extracellular domain containing protein [Haemonchus contortus]